MPAQAKRPCVYLLASKRNGTLYTGVTSNLLQRVWEHKSDFVEGFTKKYRAHHLVLSQPRNRKGLEAKGRTDGLGPSLRKSVWVIVIWRLTEY